MALVSAANATKAEISVFFNTLSCLVKNLENRSTTIDLRNEHCVTGKIVKVDAHMNIEMENVIFDDMRGNQKPLTNFFVSARNIRNIHMPKDTDALKLLRGQLQSMTRRKEKTKRVFKVARAQKKNIETIKEAYTSEARIDGTK